MNEPDPDKMPYGHYWVGRQRRMTSIIPWDDFTAPTYFRHGHTTVYRGFGEQKILRRLYNNDGSCRNADNPLEETVRPGEAIFRPAGTYHSVKWVRPTNSSPTMDTPIELSCDKDFGDTNT